MRVKILTIEGKHNGNHMVARVEISCEWFGVFALRGKCLAPWGNAIAFPTLTRRQFLHYVRSADAPVLR